MIFIKQSSRSIMGKLVYARPEKKMIKTHIHVTP